MELIKLMNKGDTTSEFSRVNSGNSNQPLFDILL